MNRRLRIAAIRLLMIMMLAVVLPVGWITALAGTAKISFSDPSAGVGEEFTVSVKINTADGTLGGADVMLSYDPTYIEFVGGSNASGGAGSVHLVGMMNSDTNTAFNFNLKFKALQAGDTKINVSDSEIYDVNTQPVSVSKTGASTVKVKAPSTYSKEAALSSLKVSPGTLEPAFSPGVTSYKVSVGSDVSKLAVSATAKDSKAKVVVSDAKLKVGENKIVCKVTAEDGQTVHSYTLKVTRAEPSSTDESSAGTQEAVLGDLKATVDEVEYSIAKSFDPSILPEGFTQSTCSYSGSEIMCGTGKGLTLIYLQNSVGSGGFYLYEPESGALSAYEVIHQPNSSIIVLTPDDTVTIPDGFVKTSVVLGDGRKITAWVERPASAPAESSAAADSGGTDESGAGSSSAPEASDGGANAGMESEADAESAQPSPDYYLIYGMNNQGDKGLYRYDKTEQTIQRYIPDPVQKSSYNDEDVTHLVAEYNSLQKDYSIRFFIMVGLIVLCLILFFIIINMLLKHREHRDNGPGGGWREEADTPVRRRSKQEDARKERQPSQGRANRREEDFYREDGYEQEPVPAARRTAGRGTGEPERRPARPDTLRVYHEEPERRTAGAGERSYRSERMPRQEERLTYSERDGRRETERPGISGRPGHQDASVRSGRQEYQDAPGRSGRQEYQDAPGRREQSERARRQEMDHQRNYRDYDFRQETGRQESRRPEAKGSPRGRQDAGMEEAMRQRENERAERARQTRERLERERREDERRAGGDRQGERFEPRRDSQPDRMQNRRRPGGGDDGFEFLDL